MTQVTYSASVKAFDTETGSNEHETWRILSFYNVEILEKES